MPHTTTVFMNNTTQAVRLPKDVAFPANTRTVEIIAVGKARLITPAHQLWDSFFDHETVSGDFMEDRDQPLMQARESL